MNSSPLCVDAHLVLRLVADPADERDYVLSWVLGRLYR
jgi:hypothetical protein